MTEDEIIHLIQIATNEEPEKHRLERLMAQDSTIPIRGWVRYLNLENGDYRAHEEVLYYAFTSFLKDKDIDINISLDLFSETVSNKLKNTEQHGERFYHINRTVADICHLSKPKGKVWYGLYRKATCKHKRPFFDYDYIDNLSASDKLWLHKFNEEYYNNHFLNDETDLHSSQDQKRECYSTNNARDRDLYAIIGDSLNQTREAAKSEYVTYDPTRTYLDKTSFDEDFDWEDALIEAIDLERMSNEMFPNDIFEGENNG